MWQKDLRLYFFLMISALWYRLQWTISWRTSFDVAHNSISLVRGHLFLFTVVSYLLRSLPSLYHFLMMRVRLGSDIPVYLWISLNVRWTVLSSWKLPNRKKMANAIFCLEWNLLRVIFLIWRRTYASSNSVKLCTGSASVHFSSS